MQAASATYNASFDQILFDCFLPSKEVINGFISYHIWAEEVAPQ